MIIAAHISALTKQLEAGLASLAIFTASWAVTDAASAAAASTAVACLFSASMVGLTGAVIVLVIVFVIGIFSSHC
jgi:hypothetical protein